MPAKILRMAFLSFCPDSKLEFVLKNVQSAKHLVLDFGFIYKLHIHITFKMK